MARTISRKASRRLSRLARIIARDHSSGCVWCGMQLTADHPRATIEHVVPLSAGGPDSFENMALACDVCNHGRMSTPAEEFASDLLHAGLPVNHAVITERLVAITGRAPQPALA